MLILTEKIILSPTVLPACVDWQQTERFHPQEGTPGKVNVFSIIILFAYLYIVFSSSIGRLSIGH